jgi:hypothetical protein
LADEASEVVVVARTVTGEEFALVALQDCQ